MSRYRRLPRQRRWMLLAWFLPVIGFTAGAANPQPAGWFTGDIHVHRSCGGAPESVTSIYNRMVSSNLNVVSLLADCGNGEVQDPATDLPLVNGLDASVSTSGRIVHWDAEWHWDATYSQYQHQALGGHILALGLTNAAQFWTETTSGVFDWAHQRGAIAGFAHFQYLDDGIPQSLTCCTPIEYPVEVALGKCDFISEDVNGSDSFIRAYYRLLNCGFRPGFAAGSDHPCAANIGTMLTYAQPAGGQLTYRNWIQAIAAGRTVVSRVGPGQFLDLKVNGTATPGDEVQLTGGGNVSVTIQWTANHNVSGKTIELVKDGVVVASQTASVGSATPANLNTSVAFTKSGWLCARTMGPDGHELHTAAVFVEVDNAPVRASATDAQFFVQWMDTLLQNTAVGGVWASYFPTQRAEAQARFSAAKAVYEQIALEAGGTAPPVTVPLGNSNDGASPDSIWSNGAWINAGRFQAVSNTTVASMVAKVGGITGKYKCAIYSDSNSLPSRLLRGTLEVTNPATGWQTFPLTAGLVLTNGNFYWLAIWSDSANAQAYYSDTSGTLRWAQVNYGAWPDPISASGNGNFNYSIYATGSAASLVSVAVTPVNPGISAGASQQFTATGTYSDGSTQNVTSQATWVSSNTVVATISAGGLATGVSTGTATISATLSGIKGTTTLTVQPAPTLSSIVVTPANSTLPVGGTQQFTATGTYSDGSTQNVTSQAAWVSSNTVVATISAGGLATGVATGSTTIAASLAGKTGSTTLAVSVSLGAYRSVSSGTWSDAAIWQTNNGAAWVAAARSPTNAATAGVISVRSGHTVTVSAGVSVDQVIVEAGGQISVNSGQTFTVANGAGTDLSVFGVLQNAGTNTISSGATAVFQPGGTYVHALNGGTIPAATWDVASICSVTGMTATLPTGLAQSFGHFTWNCPGQTAALNLETTMVVAGNFTVSSTGTGTLRLLNSTTARTLTVGGNYLQGGGTFNLKNGKGSATLNIAGDFVQTGGTFTLRSGNTQGTGTVTVAKNFSLASGTCNLSSVGAVGTLNVGGNFSHTGGTITETSTGSGAIVFTSGLHTNLSGGTVANTINYTVNNGAALMLGTSALGNGSIGTFTLASGGTLGIGDPAGITSSGATGNIRVTGARSFNTGANYIYNGSTSQDVGNGLPATVNNLTVANAAGLTINTTHTATGNCTVTPGAILLGTGAINNGPLVLNGTMSPGAGVGRFTTAGEVWNGGAGYTWEINNAGGAPGTGWDHLGLTTGQGINLQATPAIPFTLKLVTLNGGAPGLAANFSKTSTYTWPLATTTNATVTNFAANKFVIDTTRFSNDFSGGTFSVELAGNDLRLKFTGGPALLTVVTASLPNGTHNAAYSTTLTAAGGLAPYGWSIISGALPSGLTLNPTNGVIAGTPGVVGTFNFTVRVSDVSNPVQTATRALSLTITPALVSVAVTPVNPSITNGSTRQFTATGTYSDSSTQNLTTQAAWTSSSTAVATINTGGLATSVSAGTTTIAASLAGVSNSTTLTVQATPLSIATSSLPGGTANASYTTALSAAGGTTPYVWSITNGTLPGGLTLNPTNGVIAGTPVAAGTNNFTVRVSDAGNPVQTATKALSIAVISFTVPPGLIGNTNDGAFPDVIWSGGAWINAGRFQAASNLTVTTMVAKVGATAGKYKCAIYSDSGALPSRLLRSSLEVTNPATGWRSMALTSPLVLTNGQFYWLAIWSDSADAQAFYSGANGTLRWGQVNYGAWPDPLSTSGGGSYNYCIYATGTAPVGSSLAVVSVSPLAGAGGVSLDALVTATFSDAMNASTINTSTFQLRDSASALVTATISYNSANRTATLTPASALKLGATYTATVKGGPSGVADLAGNGLGADVVWSFATDSYGGGPGGPILVLTNAANPFSRYYAEILLAEGMNAFALKDISSLTSVTLNQYDVAILGQVSLTATQVSVLNTWVNAGGKLIAMRPDKQLAGLLGLTDVGTTLAEGYLQVNTASGPGAGIVGETMQYHGTADRYRLVSALSVAALYANDSTATTNPAVTLRNVGSNGGQAAAFTYDLARSIVYTRQGNPAWAGQERDGFTPMRSDDLFFGGTSTDWVNLNKVAIPQADEQQRLLANMITHMNSTKQMLPRFWYFPNGHPAVVVMTGDDHAVGGAYSVRRFNQYLAASPPGGSLANWETPRCTIYTYPSNPGLTDAQIAAYQANGFEISLHLTTGCADYTPAQMAGFFTDQLGQLTAGYPSTISPTTHRIHCIAWSGYSAPAEVSRQFGIRMETSYYYWPASWITDRPGFMTGSGMPMRFATTNGSIIDAYQAATQMTDESGQTFPYTVDTLLDRALGPEGYYGAFVANIHTDFDAEPAADSILTSALSRGVPVVSARQLLTWTDARNSSSIKSINWDNNTQSFAIEAGANATGLRVMVPVPGGMGVGSVLYNGGSIGFSVNTIKGIKYVMISALTGNYVVSYAADTTAPTIVSIQPPNGSSGVDPATDLRVSFNEAMDAATINTNTVVLLDSLGNAVAATVSYDGSTFTAVSKPVNSLQGLRTYTAGVEGGAAGVKDFAGNPLASDALWTFTTANVASYSIWSPSSVPGLVDGGADSPVELGVKFRSDVAGSITGIRFYKAPANTGTHVANLWSSTGTLLATRTFTNETASGWQQVNFTTPVAISAGTVYVASYHLNGGHYSADLNYFATAGVDNPPLHALANGVSGGNGVYAYGANSVFPNQTWNAANYWVDVVFVPAGP